MSAAALFDRLDGLHQIGPGRWNARCPAHDDRSPSLSVRELEDGIVLLHCFAGCTVESILSVVGLTFSDLYPSHTDDHHRAPERRPFPAADVLRALAHEALVVAVAAENIARDVELSGDDCERLMLAVQRIRDALSLAGVRYAA